jgi:NAD(P)-dependent dehydrogenase (short-subunit alcohol dehydrogenase family)
MDLGLTGHVALVTGGGRGIGRACCLELARLGAAVVVGDVAGVHADEVVAEINRGGGDAIAAYGSVATEEGGRALVELALARFGTLDIVVNNAGILRNNYFKDLTVEQLEAVLDVHLRGAFFVTQPAWREMCDRRYGRVINMISASGMFSHQGLSNYAAAKTGLYGLTRALAFEGADHGIRVNAVMPNTMSATTIAEGNPIPDMERYNDPAVAAVLAPRASVAPIAPLVAYLASPACAVTGEAFSVVAGRYAQVFVGVTAGWVAPDVETVTVDDVVEHLDEIRDRQRYTVPENLFEENRTAADAIRARAATQSPEDPA